MNNNKTRKKGKKCVVVDLTFGYKDPDNVCSECYERIYETPMLRAGKNKYHRKCVAIKFMEERQKNNLEELYSIIY
jgi:hypothetical protein